ncbi:hypothetical protein LDC_0622 [sediment metagenome]|uniref:Uncharacterized protein n=1 Tax=sediment metagenome TaxID=749907 RepID=D9PGH5_9ZZZZ
MLSLVLSANMISNHITEAQALFKFSITFIYLSLENGNLQRDFKLSSSIQTITISFEIFHGNFNSLLDNVKKLFCIVLFKVVKEKVYIKIKMTIDKTTLRTDLFLKILEKFIIS